MKVNGLVYRIDGYGIYLSLINDDEKITDGVPISGCPYETMTNNQISYVEVYITDGTMDLDMNVYEFVYKYLQDYDIGDIFFKIKDILVFSFDIPIDEIRNNGDFELVANDIISEMKEEKIREN